MDPDLSHEGRLADDLLDTLQDPDSIFGYMTGKVKIVGDIVGPVTPLDDWDR